MPAPVFAPPQLLRYRLVDFSRGIAALAVAVLHWDKFMIDQPWGAYSAGGLVAPLTSLLDPIYAHGGFAVPFFWMISGFVFVYVYGDTNVRFGTFAIRRIARLLPLHYLTFLLVTVLQISFFFVLGTTLFYIADIHHFILNLLFIPALGLEDGLSFNGPVWSVVVEVPIYLFFWLCASRIRLNTFNATALAVMFFVLQDIVTFNLIPYCGMMFFIGAAIYCASRWFEARVLLMLSVLGGVVGATALLQVDMLARSQTLVLIIAFSPILAFLGAGDRLLRKQPGVWDRLAAFGDLSYSIYLLHVPIIMIMTIVMIIFEVDRAILDENWLAMIIYFTLIMVASHYSLHRFEAPARQWLRKVRS